VALLLAILLPWAGALLVASLPRRIVDGLANRLGFLLVPLPAIVLATLGAADSVFDAPWIPSLGVRFALQADPLGLFFARLAAGMGLLVLVYSAGYFRGKSKDWRLFYASFLAFLGSMLGAVLADSLVLAFVFWELTGLCSFLLIGFSSEKVEARRGARLALLTTSLTGLALLAGLVLLIQASGATSWSAMLAGRMPSGPLAWTGFALLAVGAFGKSAQFPFHYWLPRAMAAPTPVSAFLHSATMVKLGVYLLLRVQPLFHGTPPWLPMLVTAGAATVLIGSILSLLSHDLKAILAYATVAQLGVFVLQAGLSPLTGLRLEGYQILAHALYKGALFMLAGWIEARTGTRDVREIVGWGRGAPLAFLAWTLALASMAGFPGTLGFFAKEALLGDWKPMLAEPWVKAAFGAFVLAAVLKIATALRLVLSAAAQPAAPVKASPAGTMLYPALALAAAGLVFGLWTGFAQQLPLPGASTLEIHPSGLLLSALLWVSGLALFAALRRRWPRLHVPSLLSWDRGAESALDGLPYAAAELTRWQRTDVPSTFLPWALVGAGAIVACAVPWQSLGGFVMEGGGWQAPGLRVFLCSVTALLTISLLFVRDTLVQILVMAASGLALITLFVLYRAPDLALTQLLVEAASLILILHVSGKLGERDRLIPGFRESSRARTALHAVLALGFGVLTAALVFYAPRFDGSARLGDFFLTATLPLAKGTNAVNTALIDLRGFDTFGEIGVLVIAALGVAALTQGRERRLQAEAAAAGSFVIRFGANALFFVLQAFALFLLLRGHNQPGGGFAGGLVSALGFTIRALAFGAGAVRASLRVDPLSIAAGGLLLAGTTAIVPALLGYRFFEHFMGPYGLGTALAFDTGVLFVVLGVTTKIALAALPGKAEA
jgi:NADH:ubiquinone oxidoreductase subunit 5 (subunit L)/multisubunit Na+/H+ antiporter MnhA subunit/multisubunit Na+/H+ antiporter MnhB subunit